MIYWKNQIFYWFFLPLNQRPFWKRSDQGRVKWYALDVQLLPNRKRRDFIPFWYKLPFRDLNTKWRIKYSSLKTLNYRNATDRVSVFRATDKLHAMQLSSLLLKEIFFSPSRKVFNLRVCPVLWGERDISKRHEFREVLIWFREQNSSSTFRKCTR